MPALVKTEVGGIQKFIFSTGKLKEMIGGSEIIYFICQPEFYGPILQEIGCDREIVGGTESRGSDWHMILQNNAGTLSLLLPDAEKGRLFLQAYSRLVLEKFPGLPLFGAQTPMDWNMASLRDARSQVSRLIGNQRMAAPVPAGLAMLPVLRAARLDGQPAVAEINEGGGRELVSLLSLCKRNPAILKRSEERLRDEYAATASRVEWTNNMEEMLPNGGKVALIHMDGNDMGKLFGRIAENLENAPQENNPAAILAKNVIQMKALSRSIEEINRGAFAHAVNMILDYILHFDKDAIRKAAPIMPLRPIVIGGDDITLIVRADLALAFTDFFVARYEKLAAEKNLPLSLGVGMVVMDSSWPFAKAFRLVETLTKSAKRLTRDAKAKRQSSIDYLVLTEEVENDVDDLRGRVYTAVDGARLTAKPFLLKKNALPAFMEEGRKILASLPRSALRPAIAACRGGVAVARELWLNTRENLARRLGGRKGRLMTANRFEHLFPDNFFQAENGVMVTRLGDYLELERLLPAGEEARNYLLKLMLEGGRQDV